MLDSVDPFALVHTTIGPEHLSVTMALILYIVPLVYIATGPGENTFARLLVILVLTIVDVTVH